jgi:hypothetical protein
MLAQVVLTPSESKKLIAKAVARLDVVTNALNSGTIMLHPSSSTYFIIEELTGERPTTNHWVCGVVTPRGMCVEMATVLGNFTPKEVEVDVGDLPAGWIIKNKKLCPEMKMSELLASMTSEDVYIKGINALDPAGNAGILVGYEASMGYILSAWRKKKFNIIYPAGLEKLIPTPINQAVSEAKPAKYEYAMGLPTGLFPCPKGKTVTEIDAIEILSSATAIPIAAGGLGGAEGAITLVIKGNDDQVKKAIEYVEQSKGAHLPQLRLCSCTDCPVPHCRFPLSQKQWASF